MPKFRLFQFLYGSIKRCKGSGQVYLIDIFQFLYGSIKRSCCAPTRISSINFNSCMVRLKDSFGCIPFPPLFNFNSCMVRLKDRGAALLCLLCLFQFLYGSIKRTGLQQWETPSLYFNSCMVRLKEVAMAGAKSRQVNFNSCMVRLKENKPQTLFKI